MIKSIFAMSILVSIFALINGLYDFTRIIDNKKIYHNVESIIRAIIIFIFTIPFANNQFLDFVLYWIYGASVFWIVFELFLNDAMRVNLFYVGTTAPLDIFVRKIFGKYAEIGLIILKSIILISSIILILVLI